MAGSSSLIEILNKQFSDVTISTLGDPDCVPDYSGLSTGLPTLDDELGGLGIPRGMSTQIAGPEGSGKSTLALQIVAHTQRNGGVCAYIDLEQTLNRGYAQALGVDIDALLVAQPTVGDDGLGVVEAIAADGSVDLVVFDSVGHMTVRREFEGTLNDANVGIRAKTLGLAVRRISPVAHKTGTAILWINQLRDNVGAVGNAPKTMSPGGRTFKHDLALEMTVVRTTALKQGEEEIGFVGKVKIVKSKLSRSRSSVDIPFYYGEGFDAVACTLQSAIDKGVLKKAGSWLKWAETGEAFAQGFERARQLLKEDPELLARLVATQV